MAHEDNFCGDRLRIAAFLRSVQGIPKRPSRFRKHPLNNDDDKQHAGSAGLGSGHQHSQDASGRLTSGDQAATRPTFLQPLEPETTNDVSSPASASATVTYQSDDLPALHESPAPSEATNEENDTQIFHSNDTQGSPLPKSSTKNVIVYTSQAKKRDVRSNEASSTRKRRLPVNELPLVRTTTENGLPDRSVGAAFLQCSLAQLLIIFAIGR